MANKEGFGDAGIKNRHAGRRPIEGAEVAAILVAVSQALWQRPTVAKLWTIRVRSGPDDSLNGSAESPAVRAVLPFSPARIGAPDRRKRD